MASSILWFSTLLTPPHLIFIVDVRKNKGVSLSASDQNVKINKVFKQKIIWVFKPRIKMTKRCTIIWKCDGFIPSDSFKNIVKYPSVTYNR